MESKNQTQDTGIEVILAFLGIVGFALYKLQIALQPTMDYIKNNLVTITLSILAIVVIITVAILLVSRAVLRHKAQKIEADRIAFAKRKKPEKPKFKSKQKIEPVPEPEPAPEPKKLDYDPFNLPEEMINVEDLLELPMYQDDTKTRLMPNEKKILERHGYKRRNFVPLGEVKPQPFYVKEQKPEGLEHTFVVNSIVWLIEARVHNVMTYTTQKPDIVFEYKGKKYALEIETPYYIKKKRKRLEAKAEVNNKEYDDWWIVTTVSSYKRCFTRYAKVLTRNELIPWADANFPR